MYGPGQIKGVDLHGRIVRHLRHGRRRMAVRGFEGGGGDLGSHDGRVGDFGRCRRADRSIVVWQKRDGDPLTARWISVWLWHEGEVDGGVVTPAAGGGCAGEVAVGNFRGGG